ncbi:hypothetical protein OG948_38120 (plasmid) [Embleya sp. NBC_00888]|uniref:hypothetical protein n=1 Tax=Embleya sp. NBC_00888 TaxID=2975960 RepID=UPI002F9093AD|nr:hypothetical protein OG948_38120 [Embleya sp. NBC_00888]
MAEVVGGYIHVDGVRAHHEDPGDGIPLLCFHAAPPIDDFTIDMPDANGPSWSKRSRGR